jgi:spermidine synthase
LPSFAADRDVLLSFRSEFQKIQLERKRGHLVLYLDDHIQFHAFDEHRYHEAFGVVPMLYARPGSVRSALVLGGGDGLLARELLAFEEIEEVVNVELDPAVVEVARAEPLASLNRRSFFDPRCHVVVGDALRYLPRCGRSFDAIFCDFPDPLAPPLAALFSPEFYALARRRLRAGGLLAVQTLYLPPVFACIHHNIRSAFAHVLPYRTPMWTMVYSGFHLASDAPLRRERPVPPWTRYLDERTVAALFAFAADEAHYLARPPGTDAHAACRRAIEEDEELYDSFLGRAAEAIAD